MKSERREPLAEFARAKADAVGFDPEEWPQLRAVILGMCHRYRKVGKAAALRAAVLEHPARWRRHCDDGSARGMS